MPLIVGDTYDGDNIKHYSAIDIERFHKFVSDSSQLGGIAEVPVNAARTTGSSL